MSNDTATVSALKTRLERSGFMESTIIATMEKHNSDVWFDFTHKDVVVVRCVYDSHAIDSLQKEAGILHALVFCDKHRAK